MFVRCLFEDCLGKGGVYRKKPQRVPERRGRKTQSKKKVYDASGRLIFSTQPNSVKTVVDVAALANGMYVIKISHNGEFTSRKIVK